MDPSDFVDVLDRARSGDEDAFVVLFRATQPAVLRYLTVLAGDRSEDLAGETWLHVVRDLERFTGDEHSAFRAWVLSIARHRWLDLSRARGRRPEALMADVPDQRSTTDTADAALDLLSTERAVKLIAGLPPQQAEVVFLRYVADLDVSETARLVGKELGAVRVLAHRGLRRLGQIVHRGANVEQV